MCPPGDYLRPRKVAGASVGIKEDARAGHVKVGGANTGHEGSG